MIILVQIYSSTKGVACVQFPFVFVTVSCLDGSWPKTGSILPEICTLINVVILLNGRDLFASLI